MPSDPGASGLSVRPSKADDGGWVRVGALEWLQLGGSLRSLTFGGTEVLRHIDFPIRDADWRTIATEMTELTGVAGEFPGRVHRFRTADGAFSGEVEIDATASGDTARLSVRLLLTATRAVEVNRAGFVLLHPIAGVAGTPVEVRRPDGSVTTMRFPKRISPGQPIFDIAGLRHRIGPVDVAIVMEGEVFEMEDQRNWTDASFKTYCRPLSRPRPFTLAAGQTVRQRVEVTLTNAASEQGAKAVDPQVTKAQFPHIALAHEAALGGRPPAGLAALGVDEILVRIDGADPSLGDVEAGARALALEVVVGAEQPAATLARVAAACAEAGVRPVRVVALPRGYLASHQPDGPWPAGLSPMELARLARSAFPGASIGGGMLTNFTEFNRCPPDPELIDFATFGGSAIVHAADDRSVIETLEALGDVFASAALLAGARPLRLGLLSIGMRSNPYGSAVAANPGGARTPMAMEDPRQRDRFGAAWSVGVAAAAARGGVASYAPAMTAGPIGLGSDGALWPIHHIVAALAALGGAEVEVSGLPSRGLVRLVGRGRRGVRGVAANLGPGPERVVAPTGARLLVLGSASEGEAAGDPGWIDRAGGAHEATLGRFDVAIFKAAAP